MDNIEIEVKSLLGNSNNVDLLLKKMKKEYPQLTLIKENNQNNHYFLEGHIDKIISTFKKDLNKNNIKQLESIISKAKSYSVRTRSENDLVLLIIKSTLDKTSSENGTARLEVEVPLSNLTLNDLDSKLLSLNFKYQAKWSRYRKEYSYKNYNVCIDKNAGYGYLAEFERVIYNKSKIATVKKEIRSEFALLGIEELSQEKLKKMFDYYNSHWQEYYGTDKIFTIS